MTRVPDAADDEVMPDREGAGRGDRVRLLALARETRGEDTAALGRLLAGYEPYLKLLARARVRGNLLQKVDVDDLVQATFLDAARQFNAFRGESEPQLTAWLRTILAGQIALAMRTYVGTAARDIGMERQIGQQLDDSSRAMGGVDFALVAGGSTPSGKAARRERAVLLAEALEKLPDDYREVIVLRDIEGHKFSEIGEKMNRSEDAAQKLWVRALGRLRAALAEVGGDDA